MKNWWWMSFVDKTEDKFLGVCIVEAADPFDAVQVAYTKGCNPGGEVAMGPLPDKYSQIASENANKLLNKEESERLAECIK